jgi:hypothetical protein
VVLLHSIIKIVYTKLIVVVCGGRCGTPLQHRLEAILHHDGFLFLLLLFVVLESTSGGTESITKLSCGNVVCC